jgi:hypothetical protein
MQTRFAPAVVTKVPRIVLTRGAAVVIAARSGATIEVADPARVSPSWVAAVVRELERR